LARAQLVKQEVLVETLLIMTLLRRLELLVKLQVLGWVAIQVLAEQEVRVM